MNGIGGVTPVGQAGHFASGMIVQACGVTLQREGLRYNEKAGFARLSSTAGGAGSNKTQGSGNRTKHHGFGKSFALVSRSLRNLKIVISADDSIPALNFENGLCSKPVEVIEVAWW
ncbi:MAG: hypothetical protein WAL90_17765 [Desulfobacterales bacterium]